MFNKKIKDNIMPILEKLNLIEDSKKDFFQLSLNLSFENWINVLSLITDNSIKSELAYEICLNFFQIKKRYFNKLCDR